MTTNVNIRPLHDRILVRRMKEDEKTAGGIIIPDTAKEKPQKGEVVATGNGRVNEDGKTFPLEVKKGDKVLFYHSVTGKEVVGIAEVSKEAFPDPTDEKWVATELKPVKPLKKPVTLAQIKGNLALANIKLVRQSQLSVIYQRCGQIPEAEDALARSRTMSAGGGCGSGGCGHH